MKYSLLDSFQVVMLTTWAEFNRGRHDAVSIEGPVVTFILLRFMEDPILIEIVAGAQGTEAQHGFSTSQTPVSTAVLSSHFSTAFYNREGF